MSAEKPGSTPLVAVVVISDLEFGGAQRQVVELANHTDENECRIHVVSLADYVPLADSLKHREKRFKLILRRARFDFTVVWRLARFLRQSGADVVHSYLFDAAIAGRLAGRLARRPVVIDTERNTDYDLKKIEAAAFRMTRWCNDLTIANSNAGAAFNSRLLGQSRGTYRVVHNGVDVGRFQPRDGAKIRAELGLSPTEPVAGMFASFKPQKNHLLWLRAARQVVQRVPNVRLLFVGDELYKGMSDSVEFKKTIHRMVDEFHLRDRCLFVGNQQQVERYYNACDVTVLPSLFEGTPNVALESMACGVPVVGTRVSDNAYVITDGRTGYVVPLDDEQALGDRVCDILLNPGLRERLSREARAWMCEEFSCRRLAEKTLAVYREAAGFRQPRLFPATARGRAGIRQ